MSPQALQPSMIVLLIDWPSLSRLIHLSLYANCPLTRLTRTNRWNKIWCPRTTKREKWESVSCSLPRRSKKKESAEIRSRYCKWSEKGMLCRSCFVAKVNRNIFNQWLDKKKKRDVLTFLQKKVQQSTFTAESKWAYANCFPFLSHLSTIVVVFCFLYRNRTEKCNYFYTRQVFIGSPQTKFISHIWKYCLKCFSCNILRDLF